MERNMSCRVNRRVVLLLLGLQLLLSLSPVSGRRGVSVPNFDLRPPLLYDRGRIHYKTTYACEGNSLHLHCEEGRHIHLVRANYGRFSLSICNDGGRLDLSVNCMSYRSFLFMQERCSQKSNCSTTVSSKMLGDPCPGTLKYLEVQYHCVHGGSSTTTRRPPIQINIPIHINILPPNNSDAHSTYSPPALPSSSTPLASNEDVTPITPLDAGQNLPRDTRVKPTPRARPHPHFYSLHSTPSPPPFASSTASSTTSTSRSTHSINSLDEYLQWATIAPPLPYSSTSTEAPLSHAIDEDPVESLNPPERPLPPELSESSESPERPEEHFDAEMSSSEWVSIPMALSLFVSSLLLAVFLVIFCIYQFQRGVQLHKLFQNLPFVACLLSDDSDCNQAKGSVVHETSYGTNTLPVVTQMSTQVLGINGQGSVGSMSAQFQQPNGSGPGRVSSPYEPSFQIPSARGLTYGSGRALGPGRVSSPYESSFQISSARGLSYGSGRGPGPGRVSSPYEPSSQLPSSARVLSHETGHGLGHIYESPYDLKAETRSVAYVVWGPKSQASVKKALRGDPDICWPDSGVAPNCIVTGQGRERGGHDV